MLVNDITPEFIASRVKQGLNGLKVAPYYGCQLVRPQYGLDDTENPRSLDRLVTCLGAEAVRFSAEGAVLRRLVNPLRGGQGAGD